MLKKSALWPRVEVICIGTELLSGKVNTHVSYLGQTLAEIGLRLSREHTVGDDPDVMRECFKEVYRRADVVLCAGGLGPTFDDITRDIWSEVLCAPLKERLNLVRDIEKKFRSRGFPMPPANRRQALILKGSEILMNDHGTAPGQFLKVGKKYLVLLPGPSRELYPMFEKSILPKLRKIYSRTVLRSKTFLIVGVPESKIDQIIRPFVDRYSSVNGCTVTHGILASQSIISVKFFVEGKSKSKVQAVMHRLATEMKLILGEMIFGEDNDTLEGVVGSLLIKKNMTLSVAESCTGGLLGKLITDQSGASKYFKEGFSVYQNESKIKHLGVKKTTVQRFGAVSPETAVEMADGVRKISKSNYSLSITGIAGPTGATKTKPVGLVYIGCAGPKNTVVKEFRFVGDRAWIRHRAALVALDILRKQLLVQ